MACAIRRRTLRPRTAWRDSQRSNSALKIRFQITAMTEAATASTPEWPSPASVISARPALAATMAIPS